jgi:hypothetical protein
MVREISESITETALYIKTYFENTGIVFTFNWSVTQNRNFTFIDNAVGNSPNIKFFYT